MCESCGCTPSEKPEKPKESSPEQIEKCNGDAKEDSCAEESE